jgi:hypothetical protein
VLLSFFWPGLGHLYVGDVGVGLALGFGQAFLAILTVFTLFTVLFAFVVWILGMVLAASAASAYNHRIAAGWPSS